MDYSMEELKEKEEELRRELEEFQKEKDKIKTLIGGIGGAYFSKKEAVVNIAFLTVILVLFFMEITTHWLPTYISLELSVLLVSIKMVWMIHTQYKYNHFVFWILNSIEYRQNEVAKRVRGVEKLITGNANANKDGK